MARTTAGTRETRCTSFRMHDRAYPNATPRSRADRRFAAQFLLTCCSQPVISAAEVGGPGCIYGTPGLTPDRLRGGLPSWNAAFLDCCPIAGDEPQVKVECPQRSEDVRP